MRLTAATLSLLAGTLLGSPAIAQTISASGDNATNNDGIVTQFGASGGVRRFEFTVTDASSFGITLNSAQVNLGSGFAQSGGAFCFGNSDFVLPNPVGFFDLSTLPNYISFEDASVGSTFDPAGIGNGQFVVYVGSSSTGPGLVEFEVEFTLNGAVLGWGRSRPTNWPRCWQQVAPPHV